MSWQIPSHSERFSVERDEKSRWEKPRQSRRWPADRPACDHDDAEPRYRVREEELEWTPDGERREQTLSIPTDLNFFDV